MLRRFVSVVLIVTLLCGCSERRKTQKSILIEDDKEYLVGVLLDLSGSFRGKMVSGGHAHAFLLMILDKYFRDRMGGNDKILIAQISGTTRSLLWQGTPLQLRQEFSSASAFAQFLTENADSNGSRVHEAIAQTADYVANDPGVAAGKVKTCLFVLSDLLDTTPDADETRTKAITAVTHYGQKGGAIGFYYVDQHLLPEWREQLRTTGIKNFCIEAEIVGRPTLPSFE